LPLISSKWITHRFAGGWATDFGPTYYGSFGNDNVLNIPFLTDARNIVFEFDGGLRKAPGTNLLNSATLVSASTAVMGVFDYWRQGTTGAPSQRRVVHVGTVIMADAGDGVFANIFTGLEAGVVPSYSTFDDLLIIGSSSTSDVPRSWDQTTAQNLAGTPPRFSFSVAHKNRQWAAGVYSAPSRLYYSVNLDPEDWVGATSGSIDIDPNDGDMIVGLYSYKNDLFVFKGPNKLSIHRITGSAPADFARTTFITGISAAWHTAIAPFGDDVCFMSPYGSVHGLKATSAFGDYNNAFLSYPIATYLRDEINNNRHRFFTAVNNANRGQVWFGITPSGQSTNTRTLLMDYRFLSQDERYPRWSYMDTRAYASLAMVRDNTTSRPRVMSGGYDGNVYRHDQEGRTDNGIAIPMNVTTPALTYGEEWLLKNMSDVAVSIQAKNDNNVTLSIVPDAQPTQVATVTQGAVGGVFDTALFDTAVFGGATYVPRFFGLENAGDFRAVQYGFSDTINNSDLEIHSFMSKITPSGESQENAIQ
jgi:hypothetical protein